MSSRPPLERDSSGETTTTASTSSSTSKRSHHAKSRRLTVLPPPLKPLAAKAPTIAKRWQPLPTVNQDAFQRALQSSVDNGDAVKRNVSPCTVCGRPECQLVMHRDSASTTTGKSKVMAASSNLVMIADEAYKSSYAYRLAQAYVEPPLGEARVDPFYNLPLSGKLDNAHNHFLFHYYFSYETKQGLQLPPIPHIPDDLILNPFFIIAMKDPAVCLSVLALATAMYPTNRALLPDKVGALEYSGQVMNLVRGATTAGNPPSDEVIIAQSFLWATSTIILDKPGMQIYAKSVHSLVQARGGLKFLGFQGRIEQLIRWIEARYCTMAHIAYTYLDVPDAPSSLLARPPPKKYGSFWDSDRAAAILSRDVLESCRSVCRKIEVVEDTFITGITMSKLWWLMGKSLFLSASRSRVLELYDGTSTFNECVMLANELGLHYALDNVVKQRNAVMCQVLPLLKAMQKIQEQFPNFLDCSYGETELLAWILCQAVMLPHDFQGKDWARIQLCRAIRSSLAEDEPMPSDWSVQIWRSFAQFTWSNLKNRKLFDAICLEIQDEILSGIEHD